MTATSSGLHGGRASKLTPTLERYAPLVVIAVQLLVLLLPDPRGQFPLNDDWAYAHSVRWLLDEHRIRLSDWVAMNLLPQTLLGGAAAALFGYSFSILRHVTQLVSILVALAAFYWFTATGLARRDALVATLVVIAMPCWPALGDSFMTDLYGMLFALPAATLYLRVLRAPSSSTPPVSMLALATLLATAGVLQRQVVFVVPAAFLVAFLAANRPWRWRTLAIGVTPFFVAAAAELAYHAYLVAGPGVPEAQQYIQGRVLPAIGKLLRNENHYALWVWLNIVTIGGYLGLFLAPWALWRGALTRGGGRWLLLVGGALIAVFFLIGWLPPYRRHNMIDAAGIGPFMLYDAQPRGLAPLDRSPGVLWRCAAIAATYGLVVLGATLCAAARSIAKGVAADRGELLYFAALVGGYLVPFFLTDYIDRYLLFVLPFAMALVARGLTVQRGLVPRAIAATWIAFALALGVAVTHDYFAWNRARWDAIHAAEGLGATPATLDGGFEYNGYYRFEVKPRLSLPGKSWWWVADDRYAVAFSVPPGYVERERFPVNRWFPRTPPAVLLVERKEP